MKWRRVHVLGPRFTAIPLKRVSVVIWIKGWNDNTYFNIDHWSFIWSKLFQNIILKDTVVDLPNNIMSKSFVPLRTIKDDELD